MNHTFFMKLAIKKAWEYQLLTYPNPAVGAVVVEDGKILSIEAHKKRGFPHAEILALLVAIKNKLDINIDPYLEDASLAHSFILSIDKRLFRNFSIYITLEPCAHMGATPSCASLLSQIEPKEVIFAIKDPIDKHSGGDKILKNASIKVTSGILEKEAKDLIEPFIIWQKKPFFLFKLAQTHNGKIGGGYLSSKESLIHVHKLREVCDFLLIGGNSVRVDRPKLDCRFIEAPPPNIKIFSKKREFDKSIPLFNIPNREVEVIDNLDSIKKGFILVEGGEGMLKALRDKIDWFLTYHTPKLSNNQITYNINAKIEFLHTQAIGKDLMIWSRFLG